jgi:hypothetical protein
MAILATMRLQSVQAVPGVAGSLPANPFVTMPDAVRYTVIVYVLLWRILPDLSGALWLGEDFDTELVVVRFMASAILNLLLLLPFVIARYAGTPIGWLHPLVLPTLLVMAKDLMKSPDTLLLPVLSLLLPPIVPDYELLRGMPLADTLAVELKRDLLLIVAQFAYFAGFALYARPPAAVDMVRRWGVETGRIAAVIAASFMVFLYFIQMSGGLITHFSSLALGRYQMREGSGHFLVVIGLLPYLALLWYAFRPDLLRKPWFVVLFIASAAAQFAATGSRSGILLPVATLLALWIWANGKVPLLRVALLALIPFFALGVLGELRSSALGMKGGEEVASVPEFDLQSAALRTREEVADRASVSGQIAIVHKVPDDVPYLYGATYISAAAFFVPRSLWPAKPRGAGAHVTAIIFEGWPSTAGYEGQSFPASGMGEAYWNFGTPGVVAVFILFGLFHRVLAQKFMQRPRDPFMALIMAMAVVTLGDISSDSLVGFMQRALLLYAAYRFSRADAFRCGGRAVGVVA